LRQFPLLFLSKVIERDQDLDWVTLQLQSTQNVHGGYFNNWFAGHLNYQIEHHLFPTMPRHNYPKVAPQVKELCKKYNIAYNEKSMLGAFKDVVRALEEAVSVYVSLKKQKKDLRIYQHLRLW
jgi:fatty acid desaturase